MSADTTNHQPHGSSAQRLPLSVTEAAIFLRTTPAVVARAIRLGHIPGTTRNGTICVDQEELIQALHSPYWHGRS